MGANFPGATNAVPYCDPVIKWPPIPKNKEAPIPGELWHNGRDPDGEDFKVYQILYPGKMVSVRTVWCFDEKTKTWGAGCRWATELGDGSLEANWLSEIYIS